jgi:hypothetical protein
LIVYNKFYNKPMWPPVDIRVLSVTALLSAFTVWFRVGFNPVDSIQ